MKLAEIHVDLDAKIKKKTADMDGQIRDLQDVVKHLPDKVKRSEIAIQNMKDDIEKKQLEAYASFMNTIKDD